MLGVDGDDETERGDRLGDRRDVDTIGRDRDGESARIVDLETQDAVGGQPHGGRELIGRRVFEGVGETLDEAGEARTVIRLGVGDGR